MHCTAHYQLLYVKNYETMDYNVKLWTTGKSLKNFQCIFDNVFNIISCKRPEIDKQT